MNAKRLLKLADALDKLPRKQFDIWETIRSDDKCGTVCCAIGLAATMPEFRRLGLRWADFSFGMPLALDGVKACVTDVAMRIFGVEVKDAASLFYANGYPAERHTPTPKQVARKIRKFVAEKASAK